MNSVSILQEWKRIQGTAPTLEDLLNPIEEKEVGDSPYRFPGGDDEIIAEVLWITNGEPDAEDDVDSDDKKEESGPSVREGLVLCEELDRLCLKHPDAEGVSILVLQQQLRKLRRHLRQLEADSQKQSTLDAFWGSKSITQGIDLH